MNKGKFIYRLINLLIDKITGFDLKKASEISDNFDFLPRKAIEKYHKEKFRELSKIASTSKYYCEFGNRPLEEFPLITRDKYQKDYPQMETTFDKEYKSRYSSGSTGIPVKQFITRDMLLAKRASHQKMLKWYGLTRESPEIKLGGLNASLRTRLYYLLRNKRYFDSCYISKETIGKIIKQYNRFRPEILYGYPSIINRLIMFAARNNFQLHSPTIIVTHGENLYNDMMANFKSAFPDVKVVNQYWATEGNIAVTCPHGNLHIDENTVVCEVINPDSNGTGDLYITNLFSHKVPLIRYAIGDRIKLSSTKCSCGRNTKIIESIDGRGHEYLEFANGDRYPITSFHEISFYDNISNFQFLYYKNESKLKFKYVPIDTKIEINNNEIESFIRTKFGLSTEFEEVSDIVHSSGGKIKRLIVFD